MKERLKETTPAAWAPPTIPEDQFTLPSMTATVNPPAAGIGIYDINYVRGVEDREVIKPFHGVNTYEDAVAAVMAFLLERSFRIGGGWNRTTTHEVWAVTHYGERLIHVQCRSREELIVLDCHAPSRDVTPLPAPASAEYTPCPVCSYDGPDIIVGATPFELGMSDDSVEVCMCPCGAMYRGTFLFAFVAPQAPAYRSQSNEERLEAARAVVTPNWWDMHRLAASDGAFGIESNVCPS